MLKAAENILRFFLHKVINRIGFRTPHHFQEFRRTLYIGEGIAEDAAAYGVEVELLIDPIEESEPQQVPVGGAGLLPGLLLPAEFFPVAFAPLLILLPVLFKRFPVVVIAVNFRAPFRAALVQKAGGGKRAADAPQVAQLVWDVGFAHVGRDTEILIHGQIVPHIGVAAVGKAEGNEFKAVVHRLFGVQVLIIPAEHVAVGLRDGPGLLLLAPLLRQGAELAALCLKIAPFAQRVDEEAVLLGRSDHACAVCAPFRKGHFIVLQSICGQGFIRAGEAVAPCAHSGIRIFKSGEKPQIVVIQEDPLPGEKVVPVRPLPLRRIPPERFDALKFDRVPPGVRHFHCIAGLPAAGALIRLTLKGEAGSRIVRDAGEPEPVIQEEKGHSASIERIADCPPERAGAKVELHLGVVHINGFLSAKGAVCWQGAARFSGAIIHRIRPEKVNRARTVPFRARMVMIVEQRPNESRVKARTAFAPLAAI